jgi:hypothetical protein
LTGVRSEISYCLDFNTYLKTFVEKSAAEYAGRMLPKKGDGAWR